ncbi:MAG: LysR family transcriptional regulator [Lentisphaeraceae bacterium]|nr:LysR family transcriptional regulator [Lentisphaeraceae bacterium]
MDKIDSLKIFCRVSEVGSYSEVARERHLSRSGISRVISQLEDEFKVQLFTRSTRSLKLTQEGKELLKDAEKILRQYQLMEEKMARPQQEVSGLLRIGVPGPLSERYILPDIQLFHELYPQIKIFFQVSESVSDLYKDELDMVIRMGTLKDSSLKVAHLTNLSFTLAASPTYLKNSPPIDSPEDLKQQNCLCFRGRGRGTTWTFTSKNKKLTQAVNGNFSADCGYTLRSMALSHQGIVAMPTPLIKNELESKSLVQVLPSWELNTINHDWSIHILYHANNQKLRRHQAFLEFMKDPNRLIYNGNIINNKLS